MMTLGLFLFFCFALFFHFIACEFQTFYDSGHQMFPLVAHLQQQGGWYSRRN